LGAWKKKFVELNRFVKDNINLFDREFHTIQEALMMAEAEIDNIK